MRWPSSATEASYSVFYEVKKRRMSTTSKVERERKFLPLLLLCQTFHSCLLLCQTWLMMMVLQLQLEEGGTGKRASAMMAMKRGSARQLLRYFRRMNRFAPAASSCCSSNRGHLASTPLAQQCPRSVESSVTDVE